MDMSELVLPAELERLVIVAGEEFGLDAQSARVCVPILAGTGEVVAIAAFWFGWPRLERLATLALACEFALVAHVHVRADQSALWPIVFVGFSAIKIATEPRLRLKRE